MGFRSMFMKYFMKILALWVVILGFTACGSSQKLVEKLPFTLGELRIEPWTVGEPNTQKGVNIYIPVQDLDPLQGALDSLYYQGKVAKLERMTKDSYQVYIGRFMDSKASNLILHADPKKEFGNKPQSRVKPPFAINEDQALLKYTMENQTHYYKLSNFIPSTAIHYNELPPSLK